jgi:hypothetical protein
VLIDRTVLCDMLHTLASTRLLNILNILFYELEMHSILRDPISDTSDECIFIDVE